VCWDCWAAGIPTVEFVVDDDGSKRPTGTQKSWTVAAADAGRCRTPSLPFHTPVGRSGPPRARRGVRVTATCGHLAHVRVAAVYRIRITMSERCHRGSRRWMCRSVSWPHSGGRGACRGRSHLQFRCGRGRSTIIDARRGRP